MPSRLSFSTLRRDNEQNRRSLKIDMSSKPRPYRSGGEGGSGLVMGWVESVMFLSDMLFPVGITIAVRVHSAELQDGLDAVAFPAGTAHIESVGDEVACRSLDDPCRDGPPLARAFS